MYTYYEYTGLFCSKSRAIKNIAFFIAFPVKLYTTTVSVASTYIKKREKKKTVLKIQS